MAIRERNYRNLKVWIAAHALAIHAYRVTESFPEQERFGLVVQLRRSLSSIASNLAEGSSRSPERVFAHFVDIAYGSAAEADYQLLLARDVGYLRDDVYECMASDLDEIRRMLASLRRTLRSRRAIEGPDVLRWTPIVSR